MEISVDDQDYTTEWLRSGAVLAAVTGTPVPEVMRGRHLRRAIEAAVRGGNDTDTVACIAGALLGAMWGASAVLKSTSHNVGASCV